MRSNFFKLQITRLGNHSANACLELAARTFGKDSPLFQVVYDFTKEKRAGYVAHIRNCVAGFIIYDNRDMEVLVQRGKQLKCDFTHEDNGDSRRIVYRHRTSQSMTER